MRKIFLLFFILALLNINSSTFAHEEELFQSKIIKNGMTLSISDCVAAAFKNSPKIKRKKYELDIAKSNVGIAKSQYFPVLSAGVGFYNENNSANEYYARHYRELPNVGVTINKMIWDFGKTTSYIKMEEFYKLGAEYEFIDSVCSTLFDIKIKYYKLLRAKALLQTAENNVEINKNFVKIAKSEEDLSTAKLNLSEAEIGLIEAQDVVENAKIDLINAMYLSSATEIDIQNTKTFNFNNNYSYFTNNNEPETYGKYEFPFTKEGAVELAYNNSPDLRVLNSTKQAMEEALKYIKKTYYPALSANAGYGLNNSNQTSNNSLQVGVNLTSAVNPMELKHSIKSAEAEVNIAENEINLFKKDLYYNIMRSFNIFERSEKQIPTAQLEAKQALFNLKLVENKYKNNKLNYIALQDARKDYFSALNGYIEKIYEYNIALIDIEMAIHCHIVDIHHKTQHAMDYHAEEMINHLNEVLECDEHEKHKKKKPNL